MRREDASRLIMSIIAADHGPNWPPAKSHMRTRTGGPTSHASSASRRDIQALEEELVGRLHAGLWRDEHAAVGVLERLCGLYCDAAATDGPSSRSLLQKADRLTKEVALPPEYRDTWLQLRSLVLSSLGLFNKGCARPHAALGCFEEAGRLLQKCSAAVDTAEGQVGAHLNICVVLCSMRKYKVALRHARAALAQLLQVLELGLDWDPVNHLQMLAQIPTALRPAGAMLSIAFHNLGVCLEALGKGARASASLKAATVVAGLVATWEDRPVTRMRQEIQHHAQIVAEQHHEEPWPADAPGGSQLQPAPQQHSERVVRTPGGSRLPLLDARFQDSPLRDPVGFGGSLPRSKPRRVGRRNGAAERGGQRRQRQRRRQPHRPSSLPALGMRGGEEEEEEDSVIIDGGRRLTDLGRSLSPAAEFFEQASLLAVDRHLASPPPPSSPSRAPSITGKQRHAAATRVQVGVQVFSMIVFCEMWSMWPRDLCVAAILE
jgi:hypothetical protein